MAMNMKLEQFTSKAESSESRHEGHSSGLRHGQVFCLAEEILFKLSFPNCIFRRLTVIILVGGFTKVVDFLVQMEV